MYINIPKGKKLETKNGSKWWYGPRTVSRADGWDYCKTFADGTEYQYEAKADFDGKGKPIAAQSPPAAPQDPVTPPVRPPAAPQAPPKPPVVPEVPKTTAAPQAAPAAPQAPKKENTDSTQPQGVKNDATNVLPTAQGSVPPSPPQTPPAN